MTDLVSLLFILMIPINCKITYTRLFIFLATIIIFGELTSATSKETMTSNIIFAGTTPIKFICQ